jgi:hypothetical protein
LLAGQHASAFQASACQHFSIQLFGVGSSPVLNRASLFINRFFKQNISSPSVAKLTS